MRPGAAALAGGLLAALAALAAACHGNDGPNTCFDSNAANYGFHLGGDTTLTFHWPASRMPVRVYTEPNGEMEADALQGMTTWVNGLRCGELSFQVSYDSTKADVIVRRVDILPPVGAARIVLAADSVNACGGRTDGAFDSTLTLDGPVRSYIVPILTADSVALAGCLRMVTTHELGHAVGLLAHSPHPADLMYVIPQRSSLSADDRYTLQQLYHTTPTIKPAPRTN